MEEKIKAWPVKSKIIPGKIYQSVNKIARSLFHPNNKQEIFYRFYGQATQNTFVVQIKKDKRNRLEFMSVFPK